MKQLQAREGSTEPKQTAFYCHRKADSEAQRRGRGDNYPPRSDKIRLRGRRHLGEGEDTEQPEDKMKDGDYTKSKMNPKLSFTWCKSMTETVKEALYSLFWPFIFENRDPSSGCGGLVLVFWGIFLGSSCFLCSCLLF